MPHANSLKNLKEPWSADNPPPKSPGRPKGLVSLEHIRRLSAEVIPDERFKKIIDKAAHRAEESLQDFVEVRDTLVGHKLPTKADVTSAGHGLGIIAPSLSDTDSWAAKTASKKSKK